jgi:hypothetical protein
LFEKPHLDMPRFELPNAVMPCLLSRVPSSLVVLEEKNAF